MVSVLRAPARSAAPRTRSPRGGHRHPTDTGSVDVATVSDHPGTEPDQGFHLRVPRQLERPTTAGGHTSRSPWQPVRMTSDAVPRTRTSDVAQVSASPGSALRDESRPHHWVSGRGSGCGLNRRTSWGQPHASAILPAHILAASSSATSTTVSPPRNSLVSTKGPSVNVNVPLVASALKTGPFLLQSSGEHVHASSLHLVDDRHGERPARAKPLFGVVAHPLLVEVDEVLGHVCSSFQSRTRCPPLLLLHERRQPDPTAGSRFLRPGGQTPAGNGTPVAEWQR